MSTTTRSSLGMDDAFQIEMAQAWRTLQRAISDFVEPKGYGIVRVFGGHGIGERFHTSLHIPHYFEPRAQTIMEPNMVFTVEPMITLGSYNHRTWKDGWTAVTTDLKRTAQFEHTVAVTEDGVEVLTPWPEGI